MLMVTDAINGDILAVRKGARRLKKSGKGVEEVLAAVKDRKYSARGPLHMAAWAGRLEMCRFLVKDLRLDVNRVGDQGLTPLIYAIIGCGSTSVLRFLLDRGANPNKADAKGLTPLHYATMTEEAAGCCVGVESCATVYTWCFLLDSQRLVPCEACWKLFSLFKCITQLGTVEGRMMVHMAVLLDQLLKVTAKSLTGAGAKAEV